MHLDKALATLEHARKLDDASSPFGRASALGAMLEIASGEAEAHLDRVAAALLRESAPLRAALAASGRRCEPGSKGVGVTLAVFVASERDAATRVALCRLYAETVAVASYFRNARTLAGIGLLAAKRLRERDDARKKAGTAVGFPACTALVAT
jgi:hypothetical protein